jgi:hypothetical protein
MVGGHDAALDRAGRELPLGGGGAHVVARGQQGAADDRPRVVRQFVARESPPWLLEMREHPLRWPNEVEFKVATGRGTPRTPVFPNGACGLLIGSMSPANSAELRKPQRAVTTGRRP